MIPIMKAAEEKNALEILAKAAEFAKARIAPRDTLPFSKDFPYDIWMELGKEKFLGAAIPEPLGGLGGNYALLLRMGETFVQYGGNLGIVLSMFLQNLAAKFLICGFGNERQKADILPKMATGEITVSFAVSEPGAGAHPKLIKTRAAASKDGYILSGEKTYLTNGPIANLFIVIAVTNVVDDKKQYSAFLVPKNLPGLSVSEPMPIDALRPSPHGGIVLKDCHIPAVALLGNAHTAYGDMAKPFREVEDVMMMGPLIGGAKYQLARAFDLIHNGVPVSDDVKSDVGKIHALVHAAELIAYDAAKGFDDPVFAADQRTAIIGFRTIFSTLSSLLGWVFDNFHLENEKKLTAMIRDLAFSGQIASNAAKAREISYGDDIINKERIP